MKKPINVLGSFKKLLKEMKPYVEDFGGKMLKERQFPGIPLKPIEVWGNWLLCAVLRKNISGEITFGFDDDGGDGVIYDRRTEWGRQTEHVSRTDNPNSPVMLPAGDARIIEGIFIKINKNYANPEHLALVVFFDGAKEWHRNKIREAINGKHKFWKIFLIGLHKKDENGYSYSVTELYENHSITYIVQINPDFTHWSVWKWEDSPMPNQ